MKVFLYRKRRWIRIISVVIVTLVTMRLCLPYAVKWYVNRTLDDIPGYYGRIEDVDIALWRGSYQIQGLQFLKVNNKIKEPLFSAKEIDIAVDWRALFKGKLTTAIILDQPELHLIKGKSEAESQTSVDSVWQDQVQKLYAFEINRLKVIDGKLIYQDKSSTPPFYLPADKINGNAENIRNADRSKKDLFTDANLTARILGSGKFSAKAALDVLAKKPIFDLDMRLENLKLTTLNDLVDAKAHFDFEEGTGHVFSEIKNQKNSFKGYVKVMLEKVDVVNWEKEKDKSLGRLLWESLVGAGLEVLENQPHDRFSVRVPFEGRLDDVQVSKWEAFKSILRNAFVKLMPKGLENSVFINRKS